MLNTVKCRESLAPTQLSIRRVIELGLDNYFYVGDKKDPERASRICIMVQKNQDVLIILMNLLKTSIFTNILQNLV